MKSGFVIRCLHCGNEHTIVPGQRHNYRNEPIVFGTDNYGADHITCDCGNALEEHSSYVGEDQEREFIVRWKEI